MKATWMLGVNHLGELIQQCNNEIWWKQNETQKYLDPNPLLIYNLYHLQKIPVQCPKGPATIVSVISIIRPHQKKTFAFHRPNTILIIEAWKLWRMILSYQKVSYRNHQNQKLGSQFHSSCFYLEMTELFMTHWIADRKKKITYYLRLKRVGFILWSWKVHWVMWESSGRVPVGLSVRFRWHGRNQPQ